MTTSSLFLEAMKQYLASEGLADGFARVSARDDDGQKRSLEMCVTAQDSEVHEVLRGVEKFDGAIRLEMSADDSDEDARLAFVQQVRAGLGFQDFIDWCNDVSNDRGLPVWGGLYVYDFRLQGLSWEREDRLVNAIILWSAWALPEDRPGA